MVGIYVAVQPVVFLEWESILNIGLKRKVFEWKYLESVGKQVEIFFQKRLL